MVSDYGKYFFDKSKKEITKNDKLRNKKMEKIVLNTKKMPKNIKSLRNIMSSEGFTNINRML